LLFPGNVKARGLPLWGDTFLCHSAALFFQI
jgi:hypothetical protein